MIATTIGRVAYRNCPRCSGDLFLAEGAYSCLQCGAEVRPEVLIAGAHVDRRLKAVISGNRVASINKEESQNVAA